MTTAVRVASIGIARLALERQEAIARDRRGRQSASAMQVMPVIHSTWSQVPTA